jgi:F5/8 type C domain
MIAIGAPQMTLQGADLLQVSNSSGWQIYPGGGYRYGPSIIINYDSSIDMWLSAPGTKPAWDCIKYRRSTDGGHTWTADVDALVPTAGSRDAYSCCDPGVIKLGSYYYIGYTSTEDSRGTDNHVYLARSISQAGPYQKWNGRGWGGDPQPILTYTGRPNAYGYGEPSLVLQDGTLYLYFTDCEGENQTDLAICSDPANDNWPANLVKKGHVINRPDDGSTDIKYVDSESRFVAVSTRHGWASNATVDVWQSFDGFIWQQTPFRGAPVQCGAHNIGISGSELGHIDTARSNFIAYAYQPVGYSWANWPTYLDPIALTIVDPGKVVDAEVSSTPRGTGWNWNGPRLIDGDPDSCWSSSSHGHASSATEWAYVDLGSVQAVTGIRVTPRTGGMCFPVDFRWQYSKDAITWTDVSGQSFTDYPNPGSKDVVFAFESALDTRYVRLIATKLSADDYGNNYLQIAEMVPIVSIPRQLDSIRSVAPKLTVSWAYQECVPKSMTVPLQTK